MTGRVDSYSTAIGLGDAATGRLSHLAKSNIEMDEPNGLFMWRTGKSCLQLPFESVLELAFDPDKRASFGDASK